MAETRHLAALAAATQTVGAKLVVVGDPQQLQAVGAGGGLLDLTRTSGHAVDLATTVRADAEWERRAELAWRSGEVASLDTYREHDRIHLTADAEQARQGVLQAWAADTAAGHESIMLATAVAM